MCTASGRAAAEGVAPAALTSLLRVPSLPSKSTYIFSRLHGDSGCVPERERPATRNSKGNLILILLMHVPLQDPDRNTMTGQSSAGPVSLPATSQYLLFKTRVI
jgi:hypothetical protein